MPFSRQKVYLRHDPCNSVKDTLPFSSPTLLLRGLFVLQSFRKDDVHLNYRGQVKTHAECSDNIYSIETGAPELLVVDATDSPHCLARFIKDVDPFRSQNCRSVEIYKEAGSWTIEFLLQGSSVRTRSCATAMEQKKRLGVS